VQTLQKGPKHVKYFPVRRTNINDDTLLIQSTVDRAIEQYKERHLQRNQIINSESGKDSPWLNYTGWKRQFVDMDMAALVRMTRLELADEDLWLKEVERQVCQMIEDAYCPLCIPICCWHRGPNTGKQKIKA